MDKKELMMIQQLMDKLSEEMEYGEEDFSERLGRKKPEIEVIKMEGKMPMEESDMEMEDESYDPEMEDMDEMDMDMEESSPEDDLKRRLMKLRG